MSADALILSRPPSVFWFPFYGEKELAPQGETLQNGAPSRGPGQLLLPLRGNSPSRALRDLQFRPFAEKRGGGKPPPYMMQMPGVTHLSRRGRR